jgi:hypothetical protein
MNIEIAQHARMSERGSSLLRLIQNQDMPILDLLIRESVQNSLDAALDNQGFVNVEFNLREFESMNLNHHFEGISDNLMKKYPSGTYKSLEIRDSNTYGLTGPLQYKDVKNNDFGNLLKLIYEISMPQQKEGAGGSWGLGKTVYFRAGAGLVIYYSRVKDNSGKYESRLAACLVENEGKEDALLPTRKNEIQRGIAWWGQKADELSTMPLTDQTEIKYILDIFGINPYKDEETGTTIIIPYIDEPSLLQGILPDEINCAGKRLQEKPWWNESLSDYISIAIQRWYAPRLMNINYNYGKWLRASVNGNGITYDKMLPLFKVVQSLYNRLPLVKTKDAKQDILISAQVDVKEIFLRNVFSSSGSAGYIAYTKLTKKQLLMLPPENQVNPFAQINKFDIDMDSNSPIILYMRKPGMVVNYETTGKWAEGIPRTSPDEFIIGIFVANSDNRLKVDETITIEEYIRKGEKADHTSWTDMSIGEYNPMIVSKIQRQLRNYIISTYSVKNSETYANRNIGLGKTLADMLLPPENFGSKASMPKDNPGSKSGKSNRKIQLKITDGPYYEKGRTKVNFELDVTKQSGTIKVLLQVLSESGGISADKWESVEVIGKPFPIVMDKFTVYNIRVGKDESIIPSNGIELNDRVSVNNYKNLSVKLLRTKDFDIPYGIKIDISADKDVTLTGSAEFSSLGESVQGSLLVVKDEGVLK